MFESEDFDLDEDFLKDIDKKEEEYYSQKVVLESESNPQAKRQKTVDFPLEPDLLSDIIFDDEPDFAKNATKSIAASSKVSDVEGVDVSSRKKRALEIFKTGAKSESEENVSQQVPKYLASKPESQNCISPNERLEASRKTLALEILRKGESLRNVSKYADFSAPKSSNQRKVSPTMEKTSKRIERPEEIGRQISSEMFKKPAGGSWNSPARLAGRNSPKFQSKAPTTPAPRFTLVRKFPGPAGLLPDSPELNPDHANLLIGLEGFETDENLEDSRISDFCSQNTEKLFSSGAWRSMLDDLPGNFLKGHEIATIKRSARDSRENSRVAFVAGVVQSIDQSIDNPRLLLKDMTDSIDATMHSDITLAHPNVIEPGVVVLLRDVGLLRFRGSHKCPGPHYHLMIAPRHLLAVYSEKARLVSSPWMDSLKKTARTETAMETPDLSAGLAKSDGSGKKILSERNSVSSDFNMEISDFESDEDDFAFGCFKLGDVKDSQIAMSFSKPASKTPARLPASKNLEKGDEKKKNILETMNPEAPKSKKKSPTAVGRKSPSNENIARAEETRNETSRPLEVEIRPKMVTGLRSKLLQFRNKNVLTPPVDEGKATTTPSSSGVNAADSTQENQEKNDSAMETFADDLLADDNDSEDEILSQLDVDSIMTSYNAGSLNPAL